MANSAGAAILLASAAYPAATTTYPLGESSGVVARVGPEPSRVDAFVVELALTGSSSPTTLDVYFQHSVDGGTNWDDFMNLHLGAVASGVLFGQWQRRMIMTAGTSPDDTGAVHAKADGALTANTALWGPVGDDWRLKTVIVGTSYTFSLRMRPIAAARS